MAREGLALNRSPFVREWGYRSSPERDILVDKDVGRAGGGELSPRSGVHDSAAAETVRNKRVQALSRSVKGMGPQ